MTSDSNSKHPIDNTTVYVATALISGSGALLTSVMPVFLGAIESALRFSEAQLGDIVAGFNIGFTLIALSAVYWVRRLDWRSISIGASCLAVVSLAAMSSIQTYSGILALTMIVGCALGGLYALGMAVMGDSDDPERAFGIKLGFETLPAAVLLFLVPAFIMPLAGFSGVMYALAGAVFLLGMGSFYLPERGVKGISRTGLGLWDTLTSTRIGYPLMALCSSVVFFSGASASWVFLELVARDRDVSADAIGIILSLGVIICGVGGLVAAVMGNRFGRKHPFIGIIAVNWIGLFSLAVSTGTTGFALGSILFLFSINFALAYTFGLTAEVDELGQLVVLSAAGISLGAIIGPAIAGRLIEAGGYDLMLGFSAFCSLITLALYLLVIRLEGASKQAVSPGVRS